MKSISRAMWWLAGCLILSGPLFAAKPPEWTLVKTPHFTVLTTGKPAKAQKWAASLERFRLAMGVLMPAGDAPLPPVTVVIFPDDKQFSHYTMLQKNGQPMTVAGYFARQDGINAIGLSAEAEDEEVRSTIFHEATHWYMSAHRERLPLWLEEGIAEVFSTFKADEHTFTVGDEIDDHVQFLKHAGLLQLPSLFAQGAGRVNYNDSLHTGRIYAASWLLVQWAMFRKKTPDVESLTRYVQLLKTERDPEDAFKAAFGGSYKEVENKLIEYYRTESYADARPKLKLPAEPLGVEAPRKATETEVEYALGTLLLTGRSAQEALPHLIRAAELDATNPAVQEALGFAQWRTEHPEEALAAFEHAIEAGSKTGRIWYLRGAMRQEANHAPYGVVRESEPGEFDRTAADYRRAIELDPLCEEAYARLGSIVYSLPKPDPDDLKRLEEGRRLFPDEPWMQAGIIAVGLRTGTPGAADELKKLLDSDQPLSVSVRGFLRFMWDTERMKTLGPRLDQLGRERRYGELVAELDTALADENLSNQSRQRLQARRTSADQANRLEHAVEALKKGDKAAAADLLHQLQTERPGTPGIRREIERLLRMVE